MKIDATPALPFVVLVIMAGRLEWLAVWAALYVAFVFDDESSIQALAFGTALGVVVLARLRRTIRGFRSRTLEIHSSRSLLAQFRRDWRTAVSAGVKFPGHQTLASRYAVGHA